MSTARHLDRIEVEGFKSIRSLDFALKPLNVLIGANGAGKSNFIGLFRLLNQMVEGRFQTAVAVAGGADALLHFGQKATDRIRVKLAFGGNGYECVWLPTADDTLVFGEETCFFNGDQVPGVRESLGAGHKETGLIDASAKSPSVPWHVFNSLKNWRVHHFHDTSDSARVKKAGAINDDDYLRPDAANLAAFLFRLRRTHVEHYQAIRDTIRLVAPYFDDFALRPMPGNEDRIRLEWRERGSDYRFLPHHLSDGTLRFICLATLLQQPEPPWTILVDEPELGLHPYAINVLASLARSASWSSQIILSTQSVTLVNQFEPEDLLVAELHDGATTIHRPVAGQMASWLDEYSLGDLWEMNVFGGRPMR